MNADTNHQGEREVSEDEWLLVVDMQRAFGAVGGVWEVEGFWDIMPRIERLVSAYKNRVIMTRYVSPDTLQGAWIDYFHAYPSMNLPGDDPAWLIEVKETHGAPVETRTRFSKWDDHMASIIGPRARLAICGVATECCVLATVLAAIDDGRHVRLVADACAGATAEVHKSTLAILASLRPLVELVQSKDVIKARE